MPDLPHTQSSITHAFHHLSKFASVVVAAIGLLVLLGWAFNIAVLKTVLPGLVSMKANTALCLLLSGVALRLDHILLKRGWVIVMTIGAVVATIGALTLTQYLFIFDTGVDQLLADDSERSDQTSFPGRSPFITAVGLLLIGLAFVCLNIRRGFLLSQAFSLTTAGLFLVALLGYLFGVRAPYATGVSNPVAVHTTLAFLLLSAGMLFRYPDRGLMSVVGGEGMGAHMARQLFLPAICLPVLLGWITMLGQHAGVYEMEFGHTLYASATLAMLAAGVWWSARQLDRIDERRIQAVESDAVHKRTEAMFRALLETAPEAVIIVNRESRIVLVNARTERLFGYGRKELVGKDVDCLLPERFHGSHVLHYTIDNGPATRPAGSDEIYGLRKDDSEFPIEISSSPHQTQDGVLAMSAIRDITERKQAADAVRASAERFRLMVEGVTDYAILVLDPEGYIVSWNAGAQRLKGYRAEEILGYHFSRFYPAEDVQCGKPEHELKVATVEGRVEDEGWRVRQDGSRFWANVIITAIREKGELRGFSKVTRDLTERKQAEEDIKESNAKLKVINQELEAFSYSVAHDLQSPLRIINGYCQALAEDCVEKLDPQAQDHLKRIQIATVRMGQLIDNLLKLSNVSRTTIRKSQVDLGALAQGLTDELKQAEPAREAEFQIQDGMFAEADPQLIRIVLANLLENAWKFTSRQPRARIEVGLLKSETETAYFVRDNGEGFDMAYVDNLFAPFQRLHSTRDFPGSGIGLATVQRIILRHGGRVWAEAEKGKGASVYFSLPPKSPV
ncbi:MAG TPA: PAS domain S-box protein [Nitrospirales bacterium]